MIYANEPKLGMTFILEEMDRPPLLLRTQRLVAGFWVPSRSLHNELGAQVFEFPTWLLI